MTQAAFGVLCFLSFVVPVPLLAWLDKPKPQRPDELKVGR
jgi:hypothetical protein